MYCILDFFGSEPSVVTDVEQIELVHEQTTPKPLFFEKRPAAEKYAGENCQQGCYVVVPVPAMAVGMNEYTVYEEN